MKRKIILHGPSTLTISLPSIWARNQYIKKGDELEVEELGHDLMISKNLDTSYGKKEIYIGNLRRIGKSSITSAYRLGFDEIIIHFKDPAFIKEIREIVKEELIGFDIILEDKNSCTIKDLTGNEKNEYNHAFKRLWYLLIDLSNESLNAIKSKDALKLKDISKLDKSINKLSNYCLRVLIKRGHSDFKKTPKYYYLVKSLEETADKYKDICNFLSLNLDRISLSLIENLRLLNKQLSELHAIYNKYDDAQLELLFLESKELSNKINLSKKGDQHLSAILIGLRNILPLILELNS